MYIAYWVMTVDKMTTSAVLAALHLLSFEAFSLRVQR